MTIHQFNSTIKQICFALAVLLLLVSANSQAVETGPRVYYLEGARNFRDFGGYATLDGREVKWGLLYRSNQLAEMTGQDYRRIAPLSLATVVDFRTAEEREDAPTQWQGEPLPLFINLPLGETEQLKELDPLIEVAVATGDLQQLRELAVEAYRRMPVEYASEFSQLLKSLAEPQTLPLLIYCYAGKDRTGLAAALILSLLGVPRDTIMVDYLLSNDLLLSEDDGRSEIEKLYWSVEREWLEASFESIEASYGSIDRYIETALGIDSATREKIKSNLLH